MSRKITKKELEVANFIKKAREDFKKLSFGAELDTEHITNRIKDVAGDGEMKKVENASDLNSFALLLLYFSFIMSSELQYKMMGMREIYEIHSKKLKSKIRGRKYSLDGERHIIFFESLAFQLFFLERTMNRIFNKQKTAIKDAEAIMRNVATELQSLLDFMFSHHRSGFFGNKIDKDNLTQITVSFISYRTERYDFIEKNGDGWMPEKLPDFSMDPFGVFLTSNVIGRTVVADYFMTIVNIMNIDTLKSDEEEGVLDYGYEIERTFRLDSLGMELSTYFIHFFYPLVFGWNANLQRQAGLIDKD